MPETVKQKYHFKLSPVDRGYVPLHEEPAYEAGTISYMEGFDMANDLSITEQCVLNGEEQLGPNIYPDELTNFEKDTKEFYHQTSKISDFLFCAFAEMYNME